MTDRERKLLLWATRIVWIFGGLSAALVLYFDDLRGRHFELGWFQMVAFFACFIIVIFGSCTENLVQKLNLDINAILKENDQMRTTLKDKKIFPWEK